MFYNIVSVGSIYVVNILGELQDVYHPVYFHRVPLKHYSNLYNYSKFDQLFNKTTNENVL